ncbi:MAG: TldD/PmbA family protein [Thermoplasmata archaeon]
MSAVVAETAQDAAARLRIAVPWEIYGQRLRRFEVYFDGQAIETSRGPILLEGAGLRVLRPLDGKTGVGFQATTDLSDDGLRSALSTAEATANTAVFPAARAELPSHAARVAQGPEICSVGLWEHAEESVLAYIHELIEAFSVRADVRPSFGSLKATLSETSIMNSEGLSTSYVSTEAELELAVKAFGGPEGRPPGEYWVMREMRALDPADIRTWGTAWSDRARDVRLAKSPPSGTLPVGLPAALLDQILPGALPLRFSGAGRLRQMGFEPGARVAAASVSIRQDPNVPWSTGSGPLDGEGSAAVSIPLIERGAAGELLYDTLHAAAFDRRSNGAAFRRSAFGPRTWQQFAHRPQPAIGTLVVSSGDVRSEAELVEGIEEGVWVDQLGWPIPDAMSGSFGGEIRLGYRIHHGKLGEPVRGGTVGGLVFALAPTPSLLGGVRAAGARAELVGQTLTPALVVDGLSIASAA